MAVRVQHCKKAMEFFINFSESATSSAVKSYPFGRSWMRWFTKMKSFLLFPLLVLSDIARNLRKLFVGIVKHWDCAMP